MADSISSLDKDVVDEVILDVASGAELRNPELRAKKLESIERQVRGLALCIYAAVGLVVRWVLLWFDLIDD